MRLIGKAKIKRYTPSVKELMHYQEAGPELKAGNILLRHFDPGFGLMTFDTIGDGGVGQEHAYGLEMFGVDGRRIDCLFGATFMLLA